MVSWAWLPEDKGRGSGVQCAGWQAAAALQFERSKNAEGLQGHHEENPGRGPGSAPGASVSSPVRWGH